MGRIQLKITAAFCLISAILPCIWLWTEYKSWQGLTVARLVEQVQPISADAIIKAWDHSFGLEKTLFPGRHLHYPAMIAQMLATEEEIETDQRFAALIQGLESARHALTREPADAYAWARKAWMEYCLNGESAEVIRALRMSIYCKPAGERLIFWRIRMSGLNRQFWDQEFKNLLGRQIIYAWRISPNRLARTVSEADIEDFARQVLSIYPAELQQFKDLVADSG
jgi:hypothetical protein